MPNRYTAVHQTAAGTGLPIINLTGGTGVRVHLAHIILGSDATPADVAGEFVIARTDDSGIGGTALTENLIDPLSPAATVAGVGGTFGTDPTSTANGNLLMVGLNQRATFTWWAREGFELLSALASGDGMMLECTGMSSGTPNMNATLQWLE
jgi:hypothetical protein